MKHFAPAIIATVITASGAFAGCPTSPPVAIKTQSGDQTVNAAWLDKTLAGKKVKFKGGGAESYDADGSYSFSEGGKSWKAPSFRFYNDGTRCVAYENPRFDRYVVQNKQLVLINANGSRFVGQITK